MLQIARGALAWLVADGYEEATPSVLLSRAQFDLRYTGVGGDVHVSVDESRGSIDVSIVPSGATSSLPNVRTTAANVSDPGS